MAKQKKKRNIEKIRVLSRIHLFKHKQTNKAATNAKKKRRDEKKCKFGF